jgi:hypothetical protein
VVTGDLPHAGRMPGDRENLLLMGDELTSGLQQVSTAT